MRQSHLNAPENAIMAFLRLLVRLIFEEFLLKMKLRNDLMRGAVEEMKPHSTGLFPLSAF